MQLAFDDVDEDATGDGSYEATEHAYPPDECFRNRLGISFTRLFAALAILAAVVDYLLVGSPDTGVPYNYPLLAGTIYTVSVVYILRIYHTIIDDSKAELIEILNRTTADNVLFERASDVSPEQIDREVDAVLDLAFHPATILVGGVIGGLFSIVVMWLLGAFQYYPHMLMNVAYGAGHGFFYGPIVGSIYLIYRMTSTYVVDIDVLDPDGVGGYKNVGDAIVNLIVLGIYLVTLDFVILSSVTFVDEPVFQAAVFALYVLMLAFLFAVTVIGVVLIRRSLLAVREQKTQLMREQFNVVEARYWEKLRRNEDPHPEAAHIETMDTMFDRLHSMELWPINLASLTRLAVSAGSSGAIAAYQAGFVSLPV